MLASLLIVGHTAPLGHHDRVCLRQPGAGEPVADELDLARLATVPLVSVIEIRAHRLRRRRAQRLLVRARVPAQAGDQRQWQSDREHPGALRHDDALGPLQRRVHVATRLTLGQPMLDLKRAHRVRWRAPAKQRNRAVDAHGVLVCMRSPKRHQPLEYYTSRPTPFRRATDRPLELEIRYCVGAVRIPPCGVPVRVSSRSPRSFMIPALRNAFTSRSTRRSATRARTRPVRAVWSSESKHASISASTIGSSTSLRAACTTRSRSVGIPSRRVLPPRLGIRRSLTGTGRKLPARSCSRSSSRNRSTPSTRSTWAAVCPSTPAERDPRFPRTLPQATSSVARSQTRLWRSENLRD